ncbi:unnamed protein product [Schistosoma margrebowiei]|uniref:Reverse transcriptase domain-containing protein n=1 Tax=Schistosoma margrebowiei TaxID=48269 RepID=A0A3P8EHS8_9TREM|nr:unnamed protein product [Schistosoma margrebowiei]
MEPQSTRWSEDDFDKKALSLDEVSGEVSSPVDFDYLSSQAMTPSNNDGAELVLDHFSKEIQDSFLIIFCNYDGDVTHLPSLVSYTGLRATLHVRAQLRDQQAGFRKDRSCTDLIATLQIIVEQSVEWNSSLYINFIDYEKAFDSVDRRTLWKRLRHYGVPEKIVNIILNSYDGLQCKVVHGGQLTDAFQVRTGVRQRCLLSPFPFLMVVDRIMKTSTSEGKHGIQWTAQNQLDDLDFADDLALLSHTHEQMQIKTVSVAAVSAPVGINIHKGKTKFLKCDTERINPITLDGETLEDVESFTYLGSIIDEQGGSGADVKARIC